MYRRVSCGSFNRIPTRTSLQSSLVSSCGLDNRRDEFQALQSPLKQRQPLQLPRTCLPIHLNNETGAQLVPQRCVRSQVRRLVSGLHTGAGKDEKIVRNPHWKFRDSAGCCTDGSGNSFVRSFFLTSTKILFPLRSQKRAASARNALGGRSIHAKSRAP